MAAVGPGRGCGSVLTSVGGVSPDPWRRHICLRAASGCPFHDLFGRLSWAEVEAVRILRNRSAVINITREDVRTLTDRWEVVFSYDGPENEPGCSRKRA